MSTINDLWKSYLEGEGYTFSSVQDTLREALLAETSSTSGQIDELWNKYLVAEGYSGALPDMLYKWLSDKGYYGSVQDMLVQALVDGDVFAVAPVGCTLTLTGDVASGFGLTPYETINVEAQSVATSSTAPRAATSTEIVVDWDVGQRRLFEIVIDADAGTTDGNVGISDLAGGNNARFLWNEWSVGDVLGFALAGDGSSEIFKDGASQGAGPTFPGNVYVLLTTTGAAFGARVITNGADMEAAYTDTSLRDWCGNDNVPMFDISAAFTTYGGDYFDFRDNSLLYQDDALLTPVTAAGQQIKGAVGGMGTFSLTNASGTTCLARSANGAIPVSAGTGRFLSGTLDTSLVANTDTYSVIMVFRDALGGSGSSSNPAQVLLRTGATLRQRIIGRSTEINYYGGTIATSSLTHSLRGDLTNSLQQANFTSTPSLFYRQNSQIATLAASSNAPVFTADTLRVELAEGAGVYRGEIIGVAIVNTDAPRSVINSILGYFGASVY